MINWTKSAGEPSTRPTFTSIACSSDGKKLVAAAASDYVYTSVDYGATWKVSLASVLPWKSVASSADGMKLLAGSSSNRLFRSTDGGSTWAALQSMPSGAYYTVASSPDGNILSAAGYNGTIYGFWISYDGGSTWADKTPAGVSPWHVAMSSDGSHLFVNDGNSYINRIKLSTNGGATWPNSGLVDPTATTHKFNSIECSSDGSTVVAGADSGGVYLSTNGGQIWTTVSFVGTGTGWVVGISGDGKTIAAGNDAGAVYVSRDGGSTWDSGTAGAFSQRIAISNNGLRLAGANRDIWTLFLFPLQTWKNVFFGSQQVQALYLGSTQFWAKP